MATVQLQHIRKVYTDRAPGKGVEAVRDFNLDIADREFIVLVGPSGCGKTSLLRMIAGLEDITDGRLLIDGRLMNNVDARDRDIAMVFQSYALYPHMSVYDNMAFSLSLRKLPRDEIDRKVREAAGILGLTEYLDRKPNALSGGQRQRVAIGRAIVRSPKVMLMDEPLSNLDAKLRNEMRAQIIKLRSRIDTTFIYVTHDQAEAMTLGDRIVIMRDGTVQQTGSAQEVFNHPANLFTAGFIGMPAMNFFNAELEFSDDRYLVRLGSYTVEPSERKQKRLRNNGVKSGPVILGVRPEHIETGKNGVEARIEVCEMMGSSVHLHASAEGDEVVIIVPFNSDRNLYNTGDTVYFSFGGSVVHLFSRETGRNLEY